jgi:hypothetical protein
LDPCPETGGHLTTQLTSSQVTATSAGASTDQIQAWTARAVPAESLDQVFG